MLFQLALNIGQRELCPVHRNVQLRQNPRQSADVVFMSVGQNDRANLFAVFSQIADIRDNNVHTQQLFFRKHQTSVDDNNVILPAEGHAVHTELAKTTQRNHLQFILCHQPSILPSLLKQPVNTQSPHPSIRLTLPSPSLLPVLPNSAPTDRVPHPSQSHREWVEMDTLSHPAFAVALALASR